jgi:uncharacterized protein YjiS (DUF1127 family)
LCDAHHSNPTNKVIYRQNLERPAFLEGRMANFNTRASGAESIHGSRPFAFSIDAKRTPLPIARFTLSLVSRLTGAFRALRQWERDKVELAKMSHYELHDIRVSSSDRWAEISKPFWRK